MTINVYGKLKEHCGLCEAAKAKLKLMGVSFDSFEISEFTTLHEGWREDDTVEVMAAYSDVDTLPIITIDGRGMSYPAAMKQLKALKPSRPVAETPMWRPQHSEVVVESEALAAVG